MATESAITVRANGARHRHELLDGEAVIGKAHWLHFDHTPSSERIFYHTTVDDAYGGRGLASKLARFALDETVGAGLKIVALCPYIKAYVRKHPEYQAETVPVRPEHLAAVQAATGTGT
jgi:predicted GNAT family acetyltransferase